MRQANAPLLKIFDDPLFTLAALILFNTVWFVLPMPNRQEEAGGKSHDTEATLASLNRQWDWLLDREKDLSKNEPNLSEQEKRLRELQLHKARAEAEIGRLQKEIEDLKQRIARERGDSVADLQANLERLERELEDKTRALASLEQEYAKLQAESHRAISEAEQERAHLQQEQQRKNEEIAVLRQQLASNQGNGNDGDGFYGSPVHDTTKDPLVVEVADNSLFFFTVDNSPNTNDYTVQHYVNGVGFTRKPDAKGEGLNEIRQANSKFRQEIGKLKPDGECVIFLVRSNSIPAFREAREVAAQMKLETGWLPIDQEEIGFGSGGQRIGTTSPGPTQ